MVLIFLSCLGQCCFWIFFLGLLGKFILHFCWIVLVNVGQWVQIHSWKLLVNGFNFILGNVWSMVSTWGLSSILVDFPKCTIFDLRFHTFESSIKRSSAVFSVSTTTCSMIRAEFHDPTNVHPICLVTNALVYPQQTSRILYTSSN